MMREKRRQSRSQVTIPVDLVIAGTGRIITRTRDVSLGGVFLETGGYKPPPVGALVELIFRIPEEGGGERRMRARVTRISTEGVAVLFREFALPDLDFLQNLLKRNMR